MFAFEHREDYRNRIYFIPSVGLLASCLPFAPLSFSLLPLFHFLFFYSVLSPVLPSLLLSFHFPCFSFPILFPTLFPISFPLLTLLFIYASCHFGFFPFYYFPFLSLFLHLPSPFLLFSFISSPLILFPFL